MNRDRRESVRTRRQQQTVEYRQHNLALRRFRHKTVEQFLADLKIPLDCCCVCQHLVYSDKTKKVSSTLHPTVQISGQLRAETSVFLKDSLVRATRFWGDLAITFVINYLLSSGAYKFVASTHVHISLGLTP